MKKDKKSKKTEIEGIGKSTREKMLARKKKFESKGNGGGIIFPKEGTMRLRVHSQGPDEEIGMEVIQFYLGPEKGGVISAATFDEPCPFMEKYKELKDSKHEDDQNLAGLLAPKRRYLIGGTLYKDEKGKEIDQDNVRRPIQIPRSVYQDLIELFLDEDDWGDMTDINDGYDIKITRTGKGKNDTSYSVSPCQRKPFPKELQKPLSLEEIVRNKIPSYDEAEAILRDFLKEDHDSDMDGDSTPVPSKKPKKDKDKKSKKKKSKSGDI